MKSGVLPKSTLLHVGDLKRHLEQSRLSPETFAVKVNISNMTLRRLLARPSSTPIPTRYQLQLQTEIAASHQRTSNELISQWLTQPEAADVVLESLEIEGMAAIDRQEAVLNDTAELVQRPSLSKKLKVLVNNFLKVVSQSSSEPKHRALALGALIYLVNPLDVIPDTIFGLGYLDDFVIMSLAWRFLQNASSQKAQK